MSIYKLKIWQGLKSKYLMVKIIQMNNISHYCCEIFIFYQTIFPTGSVLLSLSMSRKQTAKIFYSLHSYKTK